MSINETKFWLPPTLFMQPLLNGTDRESRAQVCTASFDEGSVLRPLR